MLLNGTPTGFFKSSKELRQGDPLSPYLFLMVLEALSKLMDNVIRGDLFTPCKMGGKVGDGVLVSHLLFAYDTLIFYKAN